MSEPILQVRNLQVRFGTKRGVAEVVNGISYDLHAGETLAIVGESGSGKSVGVLALLGLLAQPPAAVTGSIMYRGDELISLGPKEWRSIRGKGMAMIFQDPMTSLNPVRTVGYQLADRRPRRVDSGRRDEPARRSAARSGPHLLVHCP